jgi:flagellar biosynthetic protein FlhB
LTEEASPHRVEEYRRKGMVAQSREVSGLAALVATVIVTYCIVPQSGIQMAEFMREVFRVDLSARADLGSLAFLNTYLVRALKLMVSIGLPICGAGFLFGSIGSFVQIGSIFSLDPLIPDMDKINPLQGLQRFFSAKQLLDGLRIILKMIAILFVSYGLLKTQIFGAPMHLYDDPIHLFWGYASAGKSIFLSLACLLVVFALLDMGLQRFEYGKSIKMTKQEAKQEHKEREGDPQIRARIRSIQREMSRKRMMQAVKKADVIITNPTHIAVALVYDKSKMAAPKVVAKGADFIAQKIKQIASEAGVPLVENVPLARTLYRSVKVGQAIPHVLYQAVAEVLAYVFRLKGRKV